MTAKELENGLRALLDDALAVALSDIDETDMTLPTELEHLIRVSTFEEEGILCADPGLVLRFNNDGKISEFQVGIVRSR